MKQLFVGLIATFAFGTALAQSAPPAPVVVAPIANEQVTEPTPAPATTTPGADTAVVKTTPRVSKGVIAAGAAGALVLALAVSGGSDSDDRPSSP